MGKLGHVAIDTTRVAANASRHRVDSVEKLRREGANIRRQIRHWQQACDRTDPDEAPGTQVAVKHRQALEKRLADIPRRLQTLKKTGRKQVSRTDPDSRFLKEGRRFTLGYTVALAVSEDHLMVEQRVGQESSDQALRLPVAERAMERCGQCLERVSGDSGLYSDDNLVGLEARQIDGYVPDPCQAAELNRGRAGKHRRCGIPSINAWCRSRAHPRGKPSIDAGRRLSNPCSEC